MRRTSSNLYIDIAIYKIIHEYFFNKARWMTRQTKKKRVTIRYTKGWRKFLMRWWRYTFYILESGQWYKLFVYLSYFTCPEFSSRPRLIWGNLGLAITQTLFNPMLQTSNMDLGNKLFGCDILWLDGEIEGEKYGSFFLIKKCCQKNKKKPSD